MNATPRWGGVSQDGTYKTPEKNAIANDTCESNCAGSGVLVQNATGTRNDKWHKSDTSGSASVHGANENPGALAGATGADVHSISIVQEPYRKPGRSAMSLYAKDSHKRVCRMLGYALTLDDPVTWNQTAAILGHRLTSMELASVAYAVLSALEPETREAVYGAAQWGVA